LINNLDFIKNLAKEKPFLVLNGDIYELSNQKTGDIEWSYNIGSDLVTRSFEESLNLIDLERNTHQSIVNTQISESHKNIGAELEKFSSSTIGLNMDDPMTQFLLLFLASGKVGKVQSLEEKIRSSTGLKSKFDFKLDLHSNSKQSFAEQMLNSPIMFIDDYVFKLTNRPGNIGYGFGSIDLNFTKRGKSFNLEYVSKMNNFIKKYDAFIDSQTINKIKSKEKKYLSEVNTKKEYLKNLNFESISKEIIESGRGIFRDGNDVYVYFEKGPFKIQRLDPKKQVYKFQSCRIGLKVSYDGTHYSFQEPVRIVQAKNIQNGREIGSFTERKGKQYAHPAVTKNHKPDEYPKLCIEGKTFNDNKYYNSSKFKNVRSFFHAVDDLLKLSSNSIEHGYYLKTNKQVFGEPSHATVYSPFEFNLDAILRFKDNLVT